MTSGGGGLDSSRVPSLFTRTWDFIAGLFSRRGAMSTHAALQQLDQRRRLYRAFALAYEGYMFRGAAANIPEDQMRRLRYNYNSPIVDFATSWMVGSPVGWKVTVGSAEESAEASQKATEIWDRSGKECAFAEGVHACILYGDLPVVVRLDEEGKARFDFIDPNIATPTFDSCDADEVESLTIGYRRTDGTWCSEEWTRTELVTREDGREITRAPHGFDSVPAVWIRNRGIKGRTFGRSELDGVTALVEEYDHVSARQTHAIDYYSEPNIVVTGVKKSEFEKKSNNVYFLPMGGDMRLLAWEGPVPGVDNHLERIREAIAEVSQTPRIAFGHTDGAFTDASGVALRVLFAPLIAKTQRRRLDWAPRLERLMYLALVAEGVQLEGAEQVDIQWGEMSPAQSLELLSMVLQKSDHGLISRKQALRELRYDEDRIEQIEAERAEEAVQSAESFGRAFDRGQ